MKLKGGGGPIVARTLMEEPEAAKEKEGGYVQDSSLGVKNDDIKIAQEGIGDGGKFARQRSGNKKKRKTRGQTMMMEEERRCVCYTSKAERKDK